MREEVTINRIKIFYDDSTAIQDINKNHTNNSDDKPFTVKYSPAYKPCNCDGFRNQIKNQHFLLRKGRNGNPQRTWYWG